MYSKSPLIATGLFCTLLLAACVSAPWSDEPVGQEINLNAVVQNNLLVLPSATIDGRHGRFIFGSSELRTVIDPKFAPAATHMLQLTEKESLKVTAVNLELRGVADAIIGSDVFATHAVSIDYHAGLVTYQKDGIHPEGMVVYTFSEEPMVNVLINGIKIAAVVDTASPDTLVLPRGTSEPSRRKVHVQLADSDLGEVDVRLADVAKPRIGNRLLSKFLVSIDYGKKRVGLWRDPRM